MICCHCRSRASVAQRTFMQSSARSVSKPPTRVLTERFLYGSLVLAMASSASCAASVRAVELRRFRIRLELVQLLENLIGRISVFVELIITTDRRRERPRERDPLGQGMELHNFDHKVGGDGGVHGSGQRRVLLDQRIALK